MTIFQTRQIIIAAVMALTCPLASFAKEAPPPPKFMHISTLSSLDPVIGVNGRKLGALDMLGFVVPVVAIARQHVGESEVAENSGATMQAMSSSKLLITTELKATIADRLHAVSAVRIDELPEDLWGPVEKPWKYDEDKVDKVTEALLVIRINDATLKSYKMSDGYEPQLNLEIWLTDMRTHDDVYQEEFIYGIDAKSGKARNYPSSEECKFTGMDQIKNDGAAVARCFRAGISQIADRAAQDLVKFVRKGSVNPAPRAESSTPAAELAASSGPQASP